MRVTPLTRPLRHGCLVFNSTKPPSYSSFAIYYVHAVVILLLSVGILPGHYKCLTIVRVYNHTMILYVAIARCRLRLDFSIMLYFF